MLYARKLLTVDRDELWDLVYGDNIPVQFDDQVLYMTAPEIIISRYAWIFHEMDDTFPLYSTDTVNAYYSSDSVSLIGVLGDDFFRRLLEKLFVRLINRRGDDLDVTSDLFNPEQIQVYTRMILEANNRLYNALSYHCDRYMTGLTSLDIIALARSAELTELRAKLEEEIKNIPEEDVSDRMSVLSRLNSQALAVIKSDLILPDGSLSVASWLARRNLIKPASTLQSVFVRGYVPDIDGKMIPHMIQSNLCEGMRTITDYMVLSRESIKAMATSIKDLQDITVDGRSTSNAGMSIRSVVRGDCGSTHYFRFTPTADNIKTVASVYYKREDQPDATLRKLDASDKSLIGVPLLLRYIHGCKHPVPEYRCQVCCGGMAQSYATNESMGPVLAKAVAEINAQLSLSFKHFLASTGMNSEEVTRDRILLSDKNGFYLSEVYSGHTITMVLGEKSRFNVGDILSAASAESITASQVAKVTRVTIYATLNGETVSEESTIAPPGKDVDPSHELLRYIRVKDKAGKSVIELPEYGTAVKIDLTDFGSDTLFRKVSQIDTPRLFVLQFMAIIMNKDNDYRNKLPDNDYDGMLLELINLMSSRSDINILPLSVLLSALYHAPGSGRIGSGVNSVHGAVHSTIYERSLSTWFPHREASKPFKSADAYLPKNRGNSPLDVVICPNEVLGR